MNWKRVNFPLRYAFFLLLTLSAPLAAKSKKHKSPPPPPPPQQVVPTTLAIPGQAPSSIDSGFDDTLLVQRLVDSYRKNVNEQPQNNFNSSQQSVNAVFLNGTYEDAATILSNPASSDLFYGFDNLTASRMSTLLQPQVQPSYAAKCQDDLLKFAEAIGAVPAYNPEISQTKPLWNTDDIIDKINGALQTKVSFPNPYPCELGVTSSSGIVSERAPQSLYQAYRLKQLLKNKKNPKVLEIGGGLGRTAYYAKQFGIQDYTVVDIPFTMLSSGYFLGTTLGESAVVLPNETAKNPKQQVKFLTMTEFLQSQEKYDIVFNADGFTDMDPETAKAYWDRIQGAAPLFLSINHEANPYTVKSFVSDSSSVAEVTRYPYWMRNGYVEELVRFKQTNASQSKSVM